MSHFMANGGLEILVEASRCIGYEIFSADAATPTRYHEEFHIVIAWIGFE